MGMIDYDPSTPGIQSTPPGMTVGSDGSVNLLGNDPYKEARNRRFTYREGLTEKDLVDFIQKGIGGNYSHAGNILNDMLDAWDKGNEGSYGHYTGRLMTSNMFDEATQLADIMGSLYKDGYSREQIGQLIGQGKGIGNPDTNYTPSFDNTGGGSNPNPAGGNTGGNTPNTGGGNIPNGGVNHQQRGQRLGTWGSGYAKGGYERREPYAPNPQNRNLMSDDTGFFNGGTGAIRMFSDENEQMRQAITTALEKKLLG